MEILGNLQFWIAILSGGVAVKLLDYVLPAVFNRSEKTSTERGHLRKDIDYLRREIDELRLELERLEFKLKERDREVSDWSTRYWEEKIQKDKIITVIKHYGDEDLRGKVGLIVDESAIRDNT